MDNKNNRTNPYHFALSCISGKWKMSILNHINYYGFIRFSKTKRTFPVSEKVLSQQLKELIADGLVERVQYNEIPLRVEYYLTDAGKTIMPALDLLYTWSIHRMKEIDQPIDPDALVVHPEEKFETFLKSFIENYDDLCELFEYVDKEKTSIHSVVEQVISSKNTL